MKLAVGNEDVVSITLDAHGNLDEIFCRSRCWNGYPGALTVVDELRGRTFLGNEAETILTENSKSRLVFEKRWPDGELAVREIWTAFDDCLSWRIEAELTPGSQERSVRIKQLFPYPYPAYRLNVWSANERFPCSLDKLGGSHLFYGDACYGTVIPAVTLYDEKKNVGITLSKPFDLKSARLAFHFKDYHSDGLEVENSCLLLTLGKPAVAEVLIRAHEGCWRPGLGWLYRRYPEYFNPPNPRVHELEGGFMITNPYTEDDYLGTVTRYKVKWAEIHNHFPYYGNYAPEEKEWESVIRHDYPEAPVPTESLTRSRINRHIDSLHNNNIKGLLYFQVSGDAYIPYAEEKFPDAIARDMAGKIIPTWKECCFVNASPGTSFHDHIHRQIDKFIADYPEIDGVFLDQVCYQALDTAHQDGVTAYNNQPAAMFGHSYAEALNKLSDILQGQGKLIWGNGPFDIEVQKNIDGIMSEGISSIAASYQYLCIAKPLLVHTDPDNPENVEAMFRHCLLRGASYSIGASSTLPVPDAIGADAQEIFDKCMPLTQKLFGAKWVFAPAPLKLPPRYDGNIFYSRDSDAVLISLVSKFDSLLNPVGNVDKSIKIEVCLDFPKAVTDIHSFSCHTDKSVLCDFAATTDGVRIELSEHSVMSVIVIRMRQHLG